MSNISAARNLSTQPLDQYLSVPDARLRFRDEGGGPALVLLHGWTLDLEMWDAQVASLRQELRLVRSDRRGHGLSSGTPSPDRDASDLMALCRHLGLTRVAVLGMSQGARTALAFADSAPASVAALLLDGPPALEAAEADVPLDRLRTLARTSGMAAFRREWLHHPLTQLRSPDPRTQARVAAMVERFAGNEFADPVEPGAPESATLPGLPHAPVLVLSGELDVPSRLEAANRLAALLPRAEHAVIKGAGHLPNLDRPDEYSAICRHFLRRHLSA